MQEIWKDVPGYEGLYKVSNLGRVKSLKRKKEHILKLRKNKKGYCRSVLRKKNKAKEYRNHQLVAIAFLNHNPCGHDLVVDHIDNNPSNNKLENLQIITNRQNCTKDRTIGSSKYIGVHFCKTYNCYISKILINGKRVFLGNFINEYDAHLAYQKKLKEINSF